MISGKKMITETRKRGSKETREDYHENTKERKHEKDQRIASDAFTVFLVKR
jgi:hypothetical protein